MKPNNLFFSLLLVTILLFQACSSNDYIQKEKYGQQSKTFEKQIVKNIKINYLLYLPDNYSDKKIFPLMIFLHGAGERGEDIQKVKLHGPPMLAEKQKDFPFVLISPQCQENERWTDPLNVDALINLIDEIIIKYKIDKERIYLTGLSMGGYGTWNLASLYPDKFAAIAPVCGGGDTRKAYKLKSIPTWVFHGAKDMVVPISESETMVEALQKIGGDVKFTVYPEADHDSWTETYDNPELFKWFLRQKKQYLLLN